MSSINKGTLIGCLQHWELSPAALLLPLNFSLLFLGKLNRGQAQAGNEVWGDGKFRPRSHLL